MRSHDGMQLHGRGVEDAMRRGPAAEEDVLDAAVREARENGTLRVVRADGDVEACVLNDVVARVVGSELGLSPMQDVQRIAVIDGEPRVYGAAARTVVPPRMEAELIRAGVPAEVAGVIARSFDAKATPARFLYALAERIDEAAFRFGTPSVRERKSGGAR